MSDPFENLWAFGCTALWNKRRNLEKHRRVVEWHNIPLEEVADNPAWTRWASCRSKAMRKRLCCIVRIMGEEISFSNESLVRALSQLESKRLRIVLLYYGLEKTDEEVRSILGMSSRRLVVYHRHQAIVQLREWIEEREDDYELL